MFREELMLQCEGVAIKHSSLPLHPLPAGDIIVRIQIEGGGGGTPFKECIL